MTNAERAKAEAEDDRESLVRVASSIGRNLEAISLKLSERPRREGLSAATTVPIGSALVLLAGLIGLWDKLDEKIEAKAAETTAESKEMREVVQGLQTQVAMTSVELREARADVEKIGTSLAEIRELFNGRLAILEQEARSGDKGGGK